MKKSLSLLVAIAMVFSMFATLVSADGKAAGQKLQDLGVIKGTSAGLDEDKEWLRQDVTVLLARLLGAESEAEAHANTHGFADLDSKFYNGYVSWAKEKGYFNGETDTRFGVGNPITNQQFAAVLLRVLKVDVEYAEAFDKAVELKLVSADLDKAANAVRGNIYESIVTALDFKIDGKTLGNILGLKGYEITELDIVKASAVVSNSIVVDFNTELETLRNADVTVKNADGVVNLIEKVSFEGTKATIALSDKLSNGKTYTVSIAAATSKEGYEATNLTTEVTYNKAVPAKIAFASKTVVIGNTLGAVITDAAGNDVTADFIADVVTESSNWSVLGASGTDARKGLNVGDAIVNLSLLVDEDDNVKIETGNEIISVVALTDLTITDVSFGGAATDNNVELFQKDSDVVVSVQAKDQKGDIYVNAGLDNVTIRSLNPAIVQVDTKDGEWKATALQTGSATVQVTVEQGGVKATKSVVVTVKAERVFSSIELSTTNLKLVNPATVTAAGYTPLDYTVTVKTLDQYGKKINLTGTVDINAVHRTGSVFTDSVNQAYSNGEAEYQIEASQNGSSTIRFEVTHGNKTFSRTINVSQADLNGLGGYEVDYDAVLDKNAGQEHSADGSTATTELVVYAKDRNGVRFANINADAASVGLDLGFGTLNTNLVTLNGNTVSITGNDTGKATLTVTIDNNIVARPSIEVINTASKLTTVKQVKETIKVSQNSSILSELFGSGKALELVDQYGAQLTAADVTYTIATSNSSIVATNGDTGNAGKAVITVAINNAFYVVNVTVE